MHVKDNEVHREKGNLWYSSQDVLNEYIKYYKLCKQIKYIDKYDCYNCCFRSYFSEKYW